MNDNLYTKRLHLKRMTIADSAGLFRIWSDPHVTKFMNIDNFQEEKQAEEMIAYLEELARTNRAIRFSIFELQTNELIGSCGYNSLDFENGKTEIGYDIAKASWGNGYAPEAIAKLVENAFETLGLNRVEAKVEPGNENSIKVLEKLNFTYEGTLRQSEKSKGRFVDLLMYSKLKSDG
ncbi:GNAT family N-acetyltransferase [Sediminibacillus albus]|uniref:Ribosomal-protein-alanine N-acetyltransferase n=1 Tax=Sediminibacillus albus TaxID=407036 RepID=A0A1G8WKS0_9BACI|nr:GNAT family protein [Sediminibacillus albus]SDJ78894.1 ribosomal-protein-alanine N-acetyltransferase [Sediminibacillus albus]